MNNNVARNKFTQLLNCRIHCGRHGILPLLGPGCARFAHRAPPEVFLRNSTIKQLSKFISGVAIQVVSAFLVALSFSVAASAQQPASKVKVDFEWEQIVGSTKYEIELYNREKKLIAKAASPSANFSIELVPGAYFVRGRVYDQRTAYGEWSELSDFLVPPKQIEKIEQPPADVQVNPDTFLGTVNLKWNPPIGAHHYNVSIFDESGKVVKTLETTESHVKWILKPGVYTYKIISFTVDNVEGEPFESSQNIVIKARPVPEVQEVAFKEENSERNLTWKKETTLPTWLRLEYQKHLSNRWSQIQQETVEGALWKIPKDLKPGKYRASFWHKSPLGDVSTVKNFEFVIKPVEKDLP